MTVLPLNKTINTGLVDRRTYWITSGLKSITIWPFLWTIQKGEIVEEEGVDIFARYHDQILILSF